MYLTSICAFIAISMALVIDFDFGFASGEKLELSRQVSGWHLK